MYLSSRLDIFLTCKTLSELRCISYKNSCCGSELECCTMKLRFGFFFSGKFFTVIFLGNSSSERKFMTALRCTAAELGKRFLQPEAFDLDR